MNWEKVVDEIIYDLIHPTFWIVLSISLIIIFLVK